MTRTNRSQFKNREESIDHVVGGQTVVALPRFIVSLITQVHSLLSRDCAASNQSYRTHLRSIPRVALSAGLSLPGMCFYCSTWHIIRISTALFEQYVFILPGDAIQDKTVVLSVQK